MPYIYNKDFLWDWTYPRLRSNRLFNIETRFQTPYTSWDVAESRLLTERMETSNEIPIYSGVFHHYMGEIYTGLDALETLIVAEDLWDRDISGSPFLHTHFAGDSVKVDAGAAYLYNDVKIAYGDTSINNFYFGASGNVNNFAGDNISIGKDALMSLEFGVGGNIAIGTAAARYFVDGYNSVAIGPFAFGNSVGAANSIAIGYQSLENANQTGNNIAIGIFALKDSTNGADNVAVGTISQQHNTIGSKNASVGSDSLTKNTIGTDNVAVGFLAGSHYLNGVTLEDNIVTSYSIYIGSSTRANNTGQTNQIVIGYNADGIGSNTTVIGNTSILTTLLAGSLWRPYLDNTTDLGSNSYEFKDLWVDGIGNIDQLTLTSGATVDQIETILSDFDTRVPTSSAVKDYVDEAVAQYIYLATGQILNNGVIVSGSYLTTNEHDDIAFDLRDDTGTPGLSIELTFSGIVHSPTRVWLRAYYSGTHTVQVQLWNYIDLAWETYSILGTNSDYYQWIEFSIPDPVEHVDGSGNAKLRLLHSDNGNISHHVFIDYCALVKMGFGSTGDHSFLTGLEGDDHLQYALLLGRSGGQTLYGGTANGNNLTLYGTSSGTGAVVSESIIYGKLGIGLSNYLSVTVDTIETTLTNDNTHIPTSGAVYTAIQQTTQGWVNKTGTPVDNQIAVFVDDNTIEGDSNFTWSGSQLGIGGTIHLNNIGFDAKVYFNRTGGNQYSIQHDTNRLYVWNNTASKIIMQWNNTGSIALNSGASVDTIETTLTNDDTHLPTSGAVYDAIAQSALGFVNTTGTPANDQIAVFTDANTIEGTAGLRWDSTLKIGTTGLAGKVSFARSSDGNQTSDIEQTGVSELTIRQGGGKQSYVYMNNSGVGFHTEDATTPFAKVARLVIPHGDKPTVNVVNASFGLNNFASVYVDTIETTLTNDNTHLPTSGAVYGAISQATQGWVNTTGTPVDNQVAVFTDANTIEGHTGLTYDSSTSLLTATNISHSGYLKVPDYYKEVYTATPMTAGNMKYLQFTTTIAENRKLNLELTITHNDANSNPLGVLKYNISTFVLNGAPPTLSYNFIHCVQSTGLVNASYVVRAPELYDKGGGLYGLRIPIYANANRTAYIQMKFTTIDTLTNHWDVFSFSSPIVAAFPGTPYTNIHNRLGIDKEFPAYNLDVAGDINLTGNLTFDATGAAINAFQTSMTSINTAVPTSKAVIDYIATTGAGLWTRNGANGYIYPTTSGDDIYMGNNNTYLIFDADRDSYLGSPNTDDLVIMYSANREMQRWFGSNQYVGFNWNIISKAIVWPNVYDTRQQIMNAFLNAGDMLVNHYQLGGTQTSKTAKAPIGTIEVYRTGFTTSTVINGGSGYLVNDVLTVSGGGGNATVTVATIDGSGKVLTVTLTNAGTNYTVGGDISTTGGTGTGCKLYIKTLANVARAVDLNPSYFSSGSMFQSASNYCSWYTVSTNPVEMEFDFTSYAGSGFGIYRLLYVPGSRNQMPTEYKVEVYTNDSYYGLDRWHTAYTVSGETTTYLKLVELSAAPTELLKKIRISVYAAGDSDQADKLSLQNLIAYERYVGSGRFLGYGMSVSGDTSYGKYYWNESQYLHRDKLYYFNTAGNGGYIGQAGSDNVLFLNAPTYYQFRVGGNAALYLDGSTIRPYFDLGLSLGLSTHKYTTLYTGAGTTTFESGMFGGAIDIGASTMSSPTDGTIQWTGADFLGRKGGAWVSLTSDSNTTYNHLAVTTTGGAFIRLNGSDSSNDDVKLASGTAVTVSFTDVNTITIDHTDTSSQASVNNSNGNVIQDVTLDTYGHITGLTSIDLDTRYFTETESDARFLSFRTIDVVNDVGFTWGSSDVIADLYNDTLQIVSGTGISIETDATNDAVKITCTITDSNTTYSHSAEIVVGGVNLRLTGSDAVTDDVKFAEGSNISIVRTDDSTITIGVTGISDTNTTYSISAVSDTGSANLRLTGSDASTDDVKFIGSGSVSVAYTDDNTITITGAGGITDHGALTGLLDDDHTQYALLAGRGTGQVLKGGTAANNNLDLYSTSDPTQGQIRLYSNTFLDSTNKLYFHSGTSLYISAISSNALNINGSQLHTNAELFSTANINLTTVGDGSYLGLHFKVSRAGNLPVQSGDVLGSVLFYGNDSNTPTYTLGGEIVAITTENWADTDHGTKYVFRLCGIGDDVPSNRLELDSVSLYPSTNIGLSLGTGLNKWGKAYFTDNIYLAANASSDNGLEITSKSGYYPYIKLHDVDATPGLETYIKNIGGVTAFSQGSTYVFGYAGTAVLPGADKARTLGNDTYSWLRVYTDGIVMNNETITSIQNSSEGLSSDDGAFATSAAIYNAVVSRGYTLTVGAVSSGAALADATIYYFGPTNLIPSTSATVRRVYVPKTGAIKRAVITASTSATAGSNENWTLDIGVDNSSYTSIATVASNSTMRVWQNASLNINVTAGSYIEIRSNAVTWATNPSAITFYGTIYIE